MIFWRKQSGVTLVELLLVFVISIAFMLAAFRIYYYFEQENMIKRAQYDADQLFQAATFYYQANCRSNLSPGTNPKALNITTDLITPGFLARWAPQSNIVITNSTYQVQLQYQSVGARMPSGMIYKNWTPTPITIVFPNSVGNIYVWTIHVAVKLATGLNPAVYVARLNASCSATSPTTPCGPSVTPGNYIIWERLPSFANPAGNSNLWLSKPRVKSFVDLYYTDDMYQAYISSFGGSNTNNYLCGA